jgi:chemotaxis signal transduction protein
MTALLTPGEALQRSFDVAPPPAVEETTADSRAEIAQRRYGVRLGEYGLLLPQGAICEIAENLPDCDLPNTPDWFAGVMNQRGNIVPVFDISAMLEISDSARGSRAWVLIVGTRDEAVGLRVSRLPETLYINASESLTYNPVTQPLLDRFISTTFNCNDSLWLEWDMEGFFYAVGGSLDAG